MKDYNICCGSVNTGIYSAMIEQPTVEWMSCGHDHFSDFYGKYKNQGPYLAYGRKTGFGGFGPKPTSSHGARVFEVTMEPYGIETWIRERGGNVVVQTKPQRATLFFHAQPYCDGKGGPELSPS